MHLIAACLERARQMLSEPSEKLVMGLELGFPCCRVNILELGVLRAREFLQATPLQVLEARHFTE
jgi:hypothetical protein